MTPPSRRLGAAHALAVSWLLLARRRGTEESDTRRRVHEYVKTYPGLHLREIARGVGLDHNHVKYHLEFLERHGFVSGRKEGGFRRFFPKEPSRLGTRDAIDSQEKVLLGVLRRPVPLHVTLLLLERAAATLSDLETHVAVAHATLHYHLQRMEANGLLASRKEGRERVYELVEPDRVRALLLNHRPPDALVQGFLDAWEQLDLVDIEGRGSVGGEI